MIEIPVSSQLNMPSRMGVYFSYIDFKLFKNTSTLALLKLVALPKLVASGDHNESVVCRPMKPLNQSYHAILLPFKIWAFCILKQRHTISQNSHLN